MFGLSKAQGQKPVQYATSGDFCRIFEKDMNRLYLLSLLLTASEAAAEKCFVQGLDNSKNSNPVFKEWAESWARRTIVQNAIQIIRPRPTDILKSAAVVDQTVRTQPAAIQGVLELPIFDRFAYVLSVLEGYSLQECALLLDCSRGEVVAARMRALQEIVKSVEHHNGARAKSQTARQQIELGHLSQLAATA